MTMASRNWREFYQGEANAYHNARYGSWYGTLFAELHHKTMASVLARHPNKARCLDIASGTGHNLEILSKHCESVCATDLTPEMLKVAQHRMLGTSIPLEYVISNALHLPFPENTFDVVTSARFLHLLPPEIQKQALLEAIRVLKPNGLLAIDFYNRGHWRILSLPIACYRWLKNKRPTNDTLNTPTEVSQWLNEYGLVIERFDGVGGYWLVLLQWLPRDWVISIARIFGNGCGNLAAEQFLVTAKKY